MRVFLTSSLSLLDDEAAWDWAYKNARIQVRSDIEIITAVDMYGDDTELWSEAWEAVLPSLSHLVFFPDDDGWIDACVYIQIKDALKAGLKIYLIGEQGNLVPYPTISLEIHGNVINYARVIEKPPARKPS